MFVDARTNPLPMVYSWLVETVLRTADLPAAERFECWYQLTRESILPTIISAERTADFQASTRLLELAGVQAHILTAPKVSVSRPWKLIRHSDLETCHVTLVVRGRMNFAQAGRQARLSVGDLLFYDSSHPFEGWCANGNKATGITRHFGIRIPRSMLPHPDLPERFNGVRLPNRSGLRPLLAGYLRELVELPAEHGGAMVLGTVTADLVVALLTEEAGMRNALSPESRQRVLVAKINEFVHRHLGDPALSPERIAAAHYISTRYLHKLFQSQNLTVAGWIRRRRLERCQFDLADAHQEALSIHAIAARWGFTDSAHFSRLFKATYGIPARDYRKLAARRRLPP